MASRVRQALKSLIFGSGKLSHQCAIGLRDPQSEITVWLQGKGSPREVTQNNVMAAARPLTIGIGFERQQDLNEIGGMPLALQFRERDGQKRLLGSIGIRLEETISVGSELLGLLKLGLARITVSRAGGSGRTMRRTIINAGVFA